MRWRLAILCLLLAAVLGAGAVITVEARRSARATQANAVRVLRDYASFAAWEYARASSRTLEEALSAAIASSSGSQHTSSACDCHPQGAGIRARFQLSAAHGEWVGAPPEEPLRDTIIRSVAADHPEGESRKTRYQILPGGQGAVAWHVDSHHGGPGTAHGVVVDAPFLERALARAASQPLLPPTLIKDGDAGRLLAIRVSTREGHRLFASATPAWEHETASEAAGHGVVIAASIVRQAAPELIIGGMPRPRLLLVYGLLGVALILVMTAGYQMHRQAELTRIRADFVSGVSHELRTPLTQIRMFAETLRLGRVRSAAESSHALDVILQESQRLTQLVDKVLTFARGERAGHALDRQRVSLDEFVRGVAADLRPLCTAARVTLTTDLQPGIYAQVDPGALRQVVLNLVDNAVKYGPEGQSVTIGLRGEEGHAQLWVQDEGPGIPSSDVPRIWQPFWRRAKAGQGGSGIGLSIVDQLVRLHDGDVSLDPAYMAGARFVVTLPA